MTQHGASYLDVITTLARASGLPKKTCRKLADSLFALVRLQVWTHGVLRIPELGTFRVSTRARRRIAPPPGTVGAAGPIDLPAIEVVRFRASKNWRTR